MSDVASMHKRALSQSQVNTDSCSYMSPLRGTLPLTKGRALHVALAGREFMIA